MALQVLHQKQFDVTGSLVPSGASNQRLAG
jgi:hypothetical protein